MPTTLKYRRKCQTEGVDVFWYLDEDDSAPTTCPNNSGHTLDPADEWVVVETRKDQLPIDDLGSVKVGQCVHSEGYKLTMHGFLFTVPDTTAQDETVNFNIKFERANGQGAITAAAINTGGSGYVVDDILTISGGTGDATITVTAVDAGAITAFDITTSGTAYATGTNIATTGGSGSGATIDITTINPDVIIELYSGNGWTDSNVNIGDYINISIVDIDNILGYGAGTVLWNFAKNLYIKPDMVIHLITPDKKTDIIAGLYLRVSYTAKTAPTADIKVHSMLGFYADEIITGVIS